MDRAALDRMLAPIRQGFCAALAGEIDGLLRECEAGPSDALSARLHRLKGTAGTLGLSALSALAERAERAEESGELRQRIEELVCEMRRSVAADHSPAQSSDRSG